MELRLLEQRVEVRGDGALLEQIACCFEPAAVEPASGPGAQLIVELRADGRSLGVTTNPPGVLDALMLPGVRTPVDLTRALVQWAVDHTRHYVFHAGAVERDGASILLPADSNRGKSTLTTALAQRGFALLSDEVGVLDPDCGRLIPFPRALSLRSDVLALLGCPESSGTSLDGGASRMVRAHELGLARSERGAPLSLVVIPKFEPGAPTRSVRLRTGPALLALMNASCSQPRFKVVGLDLVIDLARRIPCHSLEFSNLREAVEQIETAFEKRDGLRS